MRKIKFMCDYREFKKGEIYEIEREIADKLLIAMVCYVV